MSAREEMFESLTPAYRAQFAPGEEESVNALLDAYRDEIAHELAVKIRRAPFSEHLLQKHQQETAAALIDPEVS